MRRASWYRVAAVTFLVGLAAGLFWLGRMMDAKGIAWAGNFGSAASLFLAALALLTPLLDRVLTLLRGPLPISSTGIAQATEDLAAALGRQWTEEERLQRVNDPRPLPVRWAVTPTADAAMPGVPRGSEGMYSPGDVSGQFDNIVSVLDGLPSRRLIILGPPGAGKSVLAVKLARDLLADRRAGMPVPVIVAPATWNPHTSFVDWIAGQLVRSHPGLALTVKSATGEVTTLAKAIASSSVLPILDGLDEMPEQARADAIAEINASGSDLPLVVTSRPEEYLEALKTTGRAISRGTVVELIPLRISEVKAYLSEATASTPTTRWHQTFDRLDEDPDGPLSKTLTTPLMLWLTRTVFEPSGSDPSELTDRERFMDREAIEQYLLDALVPAIYSSRAHPSRYR